MELQTPRSESIRYRGENIKSMETSAPRICTFYILGRRVNLITKDVVCGQDFVAYAEEYFNMLILNIVQTIAVERSKLPYRQEEIASQLLEIYESQPPLNLSDEDQVENDVLEDISLVFNINI